MPLYDPCPSISYKGYESVTNGKKADEILPRNEYVFSMEMEVPRLLGTEFTWTDMGRKRNR